jgi:uncharacterized protein YggT (Ycf19 family)
MQLIMILMIVAMILSWIDIERRSAFTRGIYAFIEPLTLPFRSVLPRLGVFDTSFLAGVILLIVMMQLIRQVSPGVKTFLPL